MSVALVGAAAIGVAGSVYASNQASDSADAANQTAQVDLEEQKRRYANSEQHLEGQGAQGEAEWIKSQEYANQGFDLAQGQSDAFQGQSEMYGLKAGEYEDAMGKYFDGFLDSFAPMLQENEGAMMDFQRRYGPLMDNVTQGIKDVSAASFAAQGREQLSLDMETLTGTMNASMASRNLGRSGISAESERRLAGDAAQQARSIDVNSNQQAMQLQGQGIQNLNSMQNMQQGLTDQRLGIMGAQGQAQQQVGQAYGNMSQNMYGASQNMFGRGFGAVNNANNNMANMYGQMGQQRINQQNSFYSGVAAPNASNLISSQNNQANAYQADAAGYMKLASTAASNVDWGKLTGAGEPATIDGNTTN